MNCHHQPLFSELQVSPVHRQLFLLCQMNAWGCSCMYSSLTHAGITLLDVTKSYMQVSTIQENQSLILCFRVDPVKYTSIIGALKTIIAEGGTRVSGKGSDTRTQECSSTGHPRHPPSETLTAPNSILSSAGYSTTSPSMTSRRPIRASQRSSGSASTRTPPPGHASRHRRTPPLIFFTTPMPRPPHH